MPDKMTIEELNNWFRSTSSYKRHKKQKNSGMTCLYLKVLSLISKEKIKLQKLKFVLN